MILESSPLSGSMGFIAHSLYPHDSERYVMIVPNQLNLDTTELIIVSFLRESPLINVWAAVIIIFSISRYAVALQRSFGDTIFNTVGLIFGTASPGNCVSGRPERILVLFISIVCLLSGILFTGFIFQQFIINSFKPTINSLEELGQHKEMEVWTLLEYSAMSREWLALQYKLFSGIFDKKKIINFINRIPNKIRKAHVFLIMEKILSHDVSKAYVLPKQNFEWIQKVGHLHLNGNPTFNTFELSKNFGTYNYKF